MRAVWSFWTKPHFSDRRSGWHQDWHHWLAWGLSFYAARQHYSETCLVTDDVGARILVEQLQLPFERVSTALNTLKDQDPRWWALGKIEAYRRQRAPFVHIDTDVFLWKPLPADVAAADVFAQNPEPIGRDAFCYRPEELEQALGFPAQGWLPKEWSWYRRNAEFPRAECCGVFGGCNIDFIHHYASTAMRLLSHPKNSRGLAVLSNKVMHMILLEQYLLTACIEYHRNRRGSPYNGVDIRYLFDTIGDLSRPERSTELGYTHLASGSKGEARICRQLELRVKRDLPEHYDRCARYFRARTGSIQLQR
ncbi:MAG: hypothetical protein LAO78_13200 [Acidobacteriia bacterium]|nr:hypothetical protein [Terriglobia bacterium]